jgi:hypothetical protein
MSDNFRGLDHTPTRSGALGRRPDETFNFKSHYVRVGSFATERSAYGKHRD